MPTAATACRNCSGVDFVDDQCARCGRPRIEDSSYLEDVEALAWSVVNAAYDKYGDLRGAAGGDDVLAVAVVNLANSLRHYHYDGDGCLDH